MTTATLEESPGGQAVAPPKLTHRQILTILSGLLLGMFLAALDQNIVSVAIVKIANSLHGFDQQAWATTAYLITATISTPLYGKLADIYGRKTFYLTAIALFVIGSAACTFATSMYELAGFRAFQGLGAGGLMSLAMTIIGDIVPPRERSRYQGYFMMVFGIATVLGPVLGGWFSGYDHLWGVDGWRWVFLVNVPIGVLALIVVARVLNMPHQRQQVRVDWGGAVALAICVVPLLIVAEQGRGWGWGSGRAILCYVIGLIGLALFLAIEYVMKDAALIPLRLFKNSTFTVCIIGGFIVGIAMFGAISMVPLYMQVVRGFSPTKAGLLMLPMVMGIMVGSLVSGQVTKRTGRYKILPVAGTFIIAVGAALYATVHYNSALWQPLVYGGIIGLGLGGCMQTLIIAVQNAGPRSDMGVSTASATFFRQVGGTLGVAVFLTILFNLLPHKIIDAFGGHLPPGFDASKLSSVQSNTAGIAALPAAVRDPILIGFTNAMHGVFWAAAGVAAVAFVVLGFMKEIPLQEASTPAGPPVAPADPEQVAEAKWAEDQVWEGAAQVVSQPEPVLAAAAVGRHGAESAVESVGAVGNGHLATANGRIAVANGSTSHGAVAATANGAVATVAAVAGESAANGSGGHQVTAVAEPSGPRASVGGWVQREDGTSVPGAALTLIDQRGHQVSRATGGDDGSYRIDTPAQGGYVLIASAPGHMPAALNISVNGGDTRLDLTLQGSGELSGSVRSAGRGEPLPNVTITLTDPRGEVVGAAISGVDGGYLCHGIGAGTYTLVASGTNLRPAASVLVIPGTGVLRHDIELTQMVALIGTVWADGAVVPNAQVTLLDETGVAIGDVRTGADGRYELPDLVQGEYTVIARGYPPVSSRVTLNGGEVDHSVELGYHLDTGDRENADGATDPEPPAERS
ncbi:MFS transporter [Nocardia sp. NBC_00511]|uniref:MFS transporter n=1 Tax=Nocardia sp. NBC_00511 TaxID=2903591 RepID=UPI0030E21C57